MTTEKLYSGFTVCHGVSNLSMGPFRSEIKTFVILVYIVLRWYIFPNEFVVQQIF